jgi:type IV secretion system protein VirB5
MKINNLLMAKRLRRLGNPYLSARKHWNEHTQGLLNSTRLWQTVALISLLITLAAVGGAVHVAGQSKFVPYVIEVDKLGQNLAVAPAQIAAPVDMRVVHASLAAFMSNARLVTPDIALQRKAIFSVYAMMNSDDPAAAKMTAWLNSNEESNPFHRAAKETVETEIVSVMGAGASFAAAMGKSLAKGTTGAIKDSASNMMGRFNDAASNTFPGKVASKISGMAEGTKSPEAMPNAIGGKDEIAAFVNKNT